MLQYTSDIICVVDEDMNIIDVNQSYQQLFNGHKMPAHINELVHEQDFTILLHKLSEALQQKKSIATPVTLRFMAAKEECWVSCKIILQKGVIFLLCKKISSAVTQEPRESSSLFTNQFFNKLSIAVVVLNRFQRIVQYNKAFSKLTGARKEGIDSDFPFSDFILEEDHDKVNSKIERCFERNRSNIPLRIRLKRSTDSIVWADIIVNILEADNNAYAIISIYDTTRYQRTAEKLASSQTNLQVLFDSSIQAHFILDQEFSIVARNEVAEKIIENYFGSKLTIGKPFLELVPPENVDSFKHLLEFSLKGHKQLEEQVFESNRRKVWFEMIFLPIYNQEEEVVGVSFSALDITMRKKNEEKIDRLSMVARKTDNAVVIMNSHGQPEWINSAFTRLTGYYLEEITTQTLQEIISGRRTETLALQAIEKAIEQKDSFQGELQCLNKYGESYWADLEITPILNEDKGEVTHFFATQKDISSLKKQAFSLSQLNKNLQREIEDRKEAEQKYQHKNNELNHFIYSASHDLRGPIASLLGLHQVVVKDVEDTTALEYIEKYHDTALTLDGLLKDLINVTEIRGRDLLIEDVHLTTQVESIFEKLEQKRVNSHPFVLKMKVDKDLRVRTDERILTIIIYELLHNALQYLKPENAEGSHIIVHAEVFSDHMWQFAVTDNGIGISESQKTSVFEIFHKGHHAAKGTGVGLYLVTIAADRLKGKVTIDSEEDVGTTVTVHLPLYN